MALEPITRAEQIMSGESLEPITREEMFIAKAAGMDVDTPTPITRREMFLSKISGGAGGSGTSNPVIYALEVTENGTYEAPNGVDGYSPVTVNVAAGGGSGDEWFNDGNTHIWITLNEGRTSPMLGVCPKGTVTVDWGDGTTPDTLTGTSIGTVRWTPNHEYAKPGDYVITLTVDGLVSFLGSSDLKGGPYILRYNSGTDDRNYTYRHTINRVEIGSNVHAVGSYAFYDCSLSAIKISESVERFDMYAFRNCYSLLSVEIPERANISLGLYVFANCYALGFVKIPRTSYIPGEAFYFCCGMRYCDFTEYTEVPPLSNTSAFKGVPTDCEIRVPAALYDEWIAATNWSTYASQIVAV